jgi:hypothetical protein
MFDIVVRLILVSVHQLFIAVPVEEFENIIFEKYSSDLQVSDDPEPSFLLIQF